MNKQLFVAALLVGLLISLGACSKSDTNQSSVANAANSGNEGKNTAAGAENKSEPNQKSGGQLTVITSADKSAVKIRSTRFTWASCATRVVDALKARSGVKEVSFDKEVRPLTLSVRFDSQKLDPKAIGEVAEQALESDEHNTAPVTVTYEQEKQWVINYFYQ